MVDKMINRINIEIQRAVMHFNLHGMTHSHDLMLARIDGMIEILSLITGKQYYFDETGIHEQ